MSGTLLSDLDTLSNSSSDDNAVQRILNEMNGSSPPPPPQVQQNRPPVQQQVINAPNPNSTIQHSIDNVPPTAHIIGNEHPTSADFAAMMYSKQQQPYYANPYQQPVPQYVLPVAKKSSYSHLMNELRVPVFVALLFFVFSLPFVNVLISNYFPSLIKATGDLTTGGLFIKSILAGSTFWVINRIIVPLLTSS
jgi:hypothetical protein